MKKLDTNQSIELLLQFATLAGDLELTYHQSTHKISLQRQQNNLLHFRLPLTFPALPTDEQGRVSAMDLQAYIQDIPLMPKPYLLLLLQAGYAAIGYCQGGEIQKHKVIRKYMVRKKQGKAQLKHLNSKGKSRAGSRIRLANTVDFFEEINAKIAEWHVIDKVAHIFYSGTSDMLHLLYQSKVAASFDKKDPRLRKLPFFTDKPLFKVLAHANYLLRLGELIEVGDVEGYNFDFLDADDVIDW